MMNEWRYAKLGELINSLNSGISVNSYDFQCSDNRKGILKTSCIYNGKFNILENKAIIEDEYTRAKLNPIKGEIIISRMNTPQLVGEIGYVDKTYNNIYLPDRLWQTELKDGVCGKWLSLVLTTDKIKEQIKNIATGTSNSMKNISKPNFLKILVLVPPLKEQEKIAEILSTWDLAIEKQKQLIEKKKEFKKGLMQRLLNGEVRFKEFKDEWKCKRLGEFLDENKEKTLSQDECEILTSSRSGIYFQKDYFSKEVASKNNIGYRIIYKGEFTYRAMSDDGNFTFNRNNLIEKGCVSPAYSVFKVKESTNAEFINYILNSNIFSKEIKKSIQGGTRLALRYSELIKIKIMIPKIQEQEKIAEVLIAADKEIELLEKELEALKLQKKGLMQRLLTGEVRVKV